MQSHLFSNNKWSMVAAEQRRRLENEISSMDDEMLLHTPIHELSNYLAQKYRTWIPVLQRDQITIEQHDATIDISSDPTRYVADRTRPQWVAGTRIAVFIPFEGDAACFDMQPTTFTFHPPRGEVQDNHVIIHIEGIGLVPDMVRARIQQIVNDIGQNLKYLQTDANRFNSNLYSYANLMIEQQRRKVLSAPDAPTPEIKIKERTGPSSPLAGSTDRIHTDRINTEDGDDDETGRRTLTPVLAAVVPVQVKPDPLLARKDYEAILQVLQNTARTLRLSPSLLRVMDDATLRSHFLVPLNARFESATGNETFSFTGESTLVIRAAGKNIFLAECKFWSGTETIVTALDRLLAQENWPEAKAAIILFHHSASFTNMLDTLRAAIRQHTGFKRELPQLSDTTYLYAVAPREERQREILLTVLAFDVP